MTAKKGKKSLALLLAAVLMVGMLPISAMAMVAPSRVLDYTVTDSGGSAGTGAVIGKSIERVYVDGDDSVYYDVTLGVTDTYRSEQVFVQGTYELRQGSGKPSGWTLFESRQACEDKFPDGDIYPVTVSFRDGAKEVFRKIFYISDQQSKVNNGTYFMGYEYSAGNWLTSDQGKIKDTIYKVDISAADYVKDLYYGVQGLNVTDAIMSGYQLVEGSINTSNGKAFYNAGGISWNLSNAVDHHYSLTYRVKMTASAVGDYPFGAATLTYKDFTTDPASVLTQLSPSPVVTLSYQTTSVTVNHYYRDDVSNNDGSVTDGTYPDTPQIVVTDGTSAASAHPALYVGDSYQAATITTGGYTLDTSMSANDPITLSASGNVINLYYTRTVDGRTADVTVSHIYKTYQWVLTGSDSDGDGENDTFTYVKQQVTSEPVEVENSSGLLLRDTAAYSTSTADVTKTDGTYAYVNGSATGSSSVTVDTDSQTAAIDLAPGVNFITLTFVKDVSDPADADLTVVHRYTKNVTTVSSDGSVVTDTDAAASYSETISGKFVGESYTASAWRTDPDTGDVYTPVSNQNLKIVSLTDGNNVIYADYQLVSAPAETSVTVHHIYQTRRAVIVGVDLDGDEIADEYVEDTETVTDSTVPVEVDHLYVGQSYTAAPVSNGYNLAESSDEASERTIILDADTGKNVIDVYYLKTEDDLNNASVVVNNIYKVNTTKVVDGTVQTIITTEATVSDTYTGYKEGESFDASGYISASYNGKDYARTDVSDTFVEHLATGVNTFNFVYERNAQDLTSATLTVNYYYYDYQMTVEDGVAQYTRSESAVLDTENSGELTDQTYYKDMVKELTDRTSYNGNTYAALTTNPSLTVTLAEGDNVIDLYYARYIPLAQVKITAVHHYADTTIAVDGTSSTENSTDTVDLGLTYVGAKVTAEAKPLGRDFESFSGIEYYEQDENNNATFTAPDADLTVDFYYAGTTGHSVPVSYIVNHYYRTIDWNEDESKEYIKLGASTGSSYATLTVTGTPDLKPDSDGHDTYALDDAETTNTFAEGSYTITLSADSENVIDFYYTSYIDTRVVTLYNYTVKYVNGYTGESLGTRSAKALYLTELSKDQVTADLGEGWINEKRPGSDYSAGEVSGYVTVTDDEESNVITVTYNYEPSDDDDTPATPVTPEESEEPEETPVVIEESEVPLAETPATEEPAAEAPAAEEPAAEEPGDVEIVEPEVPMGNLPQTGTAAEPVKPAWTLSMLALSFSMAAVGLAVTFSRKKDEEQK